MGGRGERNTEPRGADLAGWREGRRRGDKSRGMGVFPEHVVRGEGGLRFRLHGSGKVTITDEAYYSPR